MQDSWANIFQKSVSYCTFSQGILYKKYQESMNICQEKRPKQPFEMLKSMHFPIQGQAQQKCVMSQSEKNILPRAAQISTEEDWSHTVKKIRKFRGPFTVDLLRIRSVLRNTESLLLRKAEFSPPARIFRRHYFQCGQCLPKFLQVTRKVGNRLVVWNENENGVPPCSPSYIKLVSIGSWQWCVCEWTFAASCVSISQPPALRKYVKNHFFPPSYMKFGLDSQLVAVCVSW